MWSLFALAVAAPLTVSANGEMAFDLGFRDVGPLLPTPTAIINGEPALKSDWPMTGAMLVKADIEAYGSTFPITASICSSTLIAPDTVLLAAHCVDEFVLALSLPSPSNIEFGFEQNPDMSAYDFGQRQEFREAASRAVHVVSHPDFDIFSFSTNLGVARNNDIALLFLEEPLLDSELGYLPTAAEAARGEHSGWITVAGVVAAGAIGSSRLGEEVRGVVEAGAVVRITSSNASTVLAGNASQLVFMYAQCVNMTVAAAEHVYRFAQIGTEVWVHE
jgi:hypothetical protein